MKSIASYKQATLADDWDGIVIGSGPGGLSTAAMMAKEGRRILVLEQHYVAGGFTHIFKRKGYEWDVGLHYIGEVQSERSMIRRMFDYVSDASIEWADMGEVYDRICFGDREYPLYKGIDAFKDGLKSHFPDEAKAIDAYVDLVIDCQRAARGFFVDKAIPPALSTLSAGMIGRKFKKYASRTTLEVIGELTRNKQLIAVLCGQWGDYGLPPSQSSFGMHAMVVRHYLRGGAYPVGGASVIADRIAPIIQAAGGQVVTKAEVVRIDVEGGRAVGVTMADGRSFRAGWVCSGAGYINTVEHLLSPEDAQRAGMALQAKRVPRSMSHVCAYLGFKQSSEALRVPKANYWLYTDDYDHDSVVERFLADRTQRLPVTYISFPSAKDPDWERRYPGRSTVELITLAPFEWFAQWDGTRWMKRGDDYLALKAEFSERLLSELYRVEPQLEGEVDHCEISTPLSTAWFSGYRRGEIHGLSHSPERFAQRHLRPHTPIKGLFLTGQDIATAGIGGALAAGVLTASAITSRNMMSRVMAG